MEESQLNNQRNSAVLSAGINWDSLISLIIYQKRKAKNFEASQPNDGESQKKKAED
jgi:hypothetical protein